MKKALTDVGDFKIGGKTNVTFAHDTAVIVGTHEEIQDVGNRQIILEGSMKMKIYKSLVIRASWRNESLRINAVNRERKELIILKLQKCVKSWLMQKRSQDKNSQGQRSV